MKTPTKPFRAFVAVLGVYLASALVSTASAVPPMKVNFGPNDGFGFLVADCGDFNALLDFTAQGHFIVRFDQDGVPIAVEQHIRFPADIYYNSNDPNIFLTGNAVQNDHFDLVNQVVATSGLLFKLTVPGHGVVFHQAGLVRVNLETGDVIFQAGPADFDEGDTAALCAALMP